MSKFKSKNRDSKPETIVEDASAIDNNKEPVPANNFAEAAAKVEAAGVDPVAPVEVTKTLSRGVIPDQFGNNVKGERICRNCGIKESETLAKNPRYSFCKGLCVNCYGKLERKTTKPSELSVEQLEAKITSLRELLAKKKAESNGAQGLPEGNAAENVVINADNVTIVERGANVDATNNAVEELATISK